MNTAVSLDSFQLIIGLYLLYVAAKGSGTMYNFFDLPEEDQQRIKNPLRITYAVCGIIALTEAALFMWQASSGYSHIPQQTLNYIGTAMTLSIVAILIVVLIVLRKIANK